jgi:predicted component of type VI protein secretion system
LAIERFEPRLLPDTIVVSATNANKDQAVGILSFEIKALMQTSVGLDELEIMSRIDLDTGEVVLMEV